MPAPLVDVIGRHVLTAHKLHADDTPLPVLVPRLSKTKTASFDLFVTTGSAASLTGCAGGQVCPCTRPQAGHPQQHLKDFTGVLQADGFAGSNALYKFGRIREAARWVHAPSKF